ncbi:MAG: amino acid ABC transporter permease [Alphaproteobacteria bacterium]
MNFDFAQIGPSIPYIMKGALVTLQYTSLSVCFGSILGAVLAFLKQAESGFLRGFAGVYTSIFRGTPLLVQLMLIYFATPQLFGYKITAFEAGILAFSLNSAAYVSEVMRAGIKAVEKGQLEAAISLGLSRRQAMIDIVLPQAFKNTLPALVNEIVDLLKESALISVLGEADLLRRANIVSAETYLYFEPLLVAAGMYYVMVLILTQLASTLEYRLKRSD